MRVLVTGGAGFIGSHTVDGLLEKGHEVRVLDNLEERVHPGGKPGYLAEEAEFIRGDVRDKGDLKDAMEGVDVVFHVAAYQDYMPDYSRFFRTNVVSTALIYELIEEHEFPVSKVVIASSQSVYGEGRHKCPEHGVVQAEPRKEEQLKRGEWGVKCPVCGGDTEFLNHSEDYPNPYNQYALSKYSEELTGLRLGKLLEVPTVALRYSITQGPRQSPYNQYSGVCRIFTLRLLHDEPPVVYEDGKQLRDYTHIDDVVDANMVALERDEANYEAFNVGSGRAYSVLEYARKLAKALGKEVEPEVPGEYRVGDTRHSVSDISKLKELGWEPTKGLDEILEDYIDWIKDRGEVGEYFEEADKKMREKGIIKEAESKKLAESKISYKLKGES